MLADRINGKSCPFSSDIDKQMELGFNTLEIQLFDNQLESRENTLRLVDNCKKDGLDIKSIHSPLSKVVYSHFNTTLDICHALAAVRLLKVLYAHDYTYNGRYIYMEDFVKENSETCNNIHFNWLTDFGFRDGEHGTIVDKDDKELAEVIGYINKYLSKDAKFTIEVLEKDYQNPKNCVILREALYYVENKLRMSL